MKPTNKIKEFMGKMSIRTKKGLLAGIGALVVFAVVIAMLLNNKTENPYTILFSGLNDQEATEVMAKLQTNGIDYHYTADGSITVPPEIVDKTRATLAMEGYPKSGFTYDIVLDNTNMMSTEKDKKSLQVYEMQNRLQATIRLFDDVSNAVVNISPGETQKYVLDNSGVTKPTASVMVVMRDNVTPSKELVSAIQRLVAKSIANMDAGDVAVIDGNGIDVSVKKNDTGMLASDEKMDIEEKNQLIIENNILHVLEDMYGRNNVRVSVKCTADVSKRVSEESEYTAPNTQNNSGYISEQSIYNEGSGGAGTGGVPGADTNANLPQYNTQTGQGENYYSNTSDTNYALNQKKVQSQNEGATIVDTTVAVSINTTDLRIDRNDLIRLIGNAAGIDSTIQAEKIVVVDSQWATTILKDEGEDGGAQQVVTPPDIPGEDRTKLAIAIGIAVGVLLLLLIILLIVGRRIRKKRERELERAMMEAPVDPQEALAELAKAHVPPISVEDERDKEVKENIRGFARENPEISAQLLKNWLRGGENDA